MDSLFGREESRREDMGEAAGKYLSSLPTEKRLSEFISLARKAMITGCVDRINDIVDFDKRGGKADYISPEGLATAVYSGGISFICAAMSESDGFGGLTDCDERVSTMFSALSEDGALVILSRLYSEAPRYRTAGALAKLCSISADAAEGILKKLLEQLQLETEDGTVNAYSITSGSAAIPLLIAAKLVINNNSFMTIISDSRAKLFDNGGEKGE